MSSRGSPPWRYQVELHIDGSRTSTLAAAVRCRDISQTYRRRSNAATGIEFPRIRSSETRLGALRRLCRARKEGRDESRPGRQECLRNMGIRDRFYENHY